MKEYDEKAPSKYIMYLDTNNLYGWAMSQHLPTGNFKWMTDKEISKINLGKYKADGKKGLILEVDLEYPQELHDIHNDYPIAPEKVNRKNHLILIMTPEKQDKTLELSKHWSVDSTPARNEVIMKRTYPVKSVKCDKICSNY